MYQCVYEICIYVYMCLYILVCVYFVCVQRGDSGNLANSWNRNLALQEALLPAPGVVSYYYPLCDWGRVLSMGRKTGGTAETIMSETCPSLWRPPLFSPIPLVETVLIKGCFYVPFLSGDVVSPLAISVSIARRICKAYFWLFPSGLLLLSPSGDCCSFPASLPQIPSYYTQQLLPPAFISLSQLTGPSSKGIQFLSTPENELGGTARQPRLTQNPSTICVPMYKWRRVHETAGKWLSKKNLNCQSFAHLI